MRFGDLQGLTSLPIDRIGHRFRNEDVLTVLPVSGAVPGYDAILVATASDLVVLSGDGEPESEEWITQWAAWESVRLADGGVPATTDEETYALVIHVGGLTFHALLRGLGGQQALREFVVATQARQAAHMSSR